MIVAAINKRVSSLEALWHPQDGREPPICNSENIATRRLSMFETPNTLKTMSAPHTELYSKERPLISCSMLGQMCAGEDLDEDIGLIDALEAINEL